MPHAGQLPVAEKEFHVVALGATGQHTQYVPGGVVQVHGQQGVALVRDRPQPGLRLAEVPGQGQAVAGGCQQFGGHLEAEGVLRPGQDLHLAGLVHDPVEVAVLVLADAHRVELLLLRQHRGVGLDDLVPLARGQHQQGVVGVVGGEPR